jgi:protease II
VANIRGGGEFGPDWHQAALKTKRQIAYDDFASVARDMIARKVTTQYFYSYLASKALIMGSVNISHSARANHFAQNVTATQS